MPKDRLLRYGKFTLCEENLSFGQLNGREVIIQLIIDDNVPDRGHRTNIFTPGFMMMACFSGNHTKFKTMTTINYSGGVQQENEEL